MSSFALLAIINLVLLVRIYRRSRAGRASRPARPPLAGRTRLTIAFAVVLFIAAIASTEAIGSRDSTGSHTLDVVAPLVGYAALLFAWRAYRRERPSPPAQRGWRR